MKKIVFMPYKASMWDSLESIWMAASKDPECDVRVVVIPYYNKNSDGSFGKLRYEGDLMPECVQVTHYSEYILDEERPDIIYIHNPYDMGNNATSVDPAYYSMELKKYCKKLVYVPYYVSIRGMGDAQALCFSYIYADYIIAQSEYMVSCFDETVPRRKIIPLGSPKLDRVIKLCAQGRALPKEWSMAEGKRVYFYNTSLNELLAKPDIYLKKMRYVFECFVGAKDACLLWRPHPLFEQTIRSMVPECLEEFLGLKEWYIKENIGIYDDSADMDTALVISDIYIGDSSTSLTALFGMAGKPMFLLNNMNYGQYKYELLEKYIVSRDIHGRYNPKWAILKGNFLYKADKDYEYHYFCNLTEQYSVDFLYSKIWEYGDRLYITPISSQDIIIADETGMLRKVVLKKHNKTFESFKDSILINNFLFLIPSNYPSLVIYDIENDTVDYIDDYGDGNNGGATAMNENLLVAARDGSSLLVINASTGDIELMQTGLMIEEGCADIFYNSGDLWFVSATYEQLYRLDMRTNDMYTYSDMPNDYKGVFFKDDELFLYNPYEGSMIKLDKNTGDFSVAKNILLETPVKLDEEELRSHTPYFAKQNEAIHYACMEDYFNDLRSFININPTDWGFDRDKQLKAFSKIAENIDGSSGEKIHRFVVDSCE